MKPEIEPEVEPEVKPEMELGLIFRGLQQHQGIRVGQRHQFLFSLQQLLDPVLIGQQARNRHNLSYEQLKVIE